MPHRPRLRVAPIPRLGALLAPVASVLAGLAIAAPATLSLTLAAAPLSAQAGAPYDTLLFRGLEWRNLGPDRGGRSIAVVGSDLRPLEYYFGATGGGLWKTTDGGTTWEPVTDGQITSASIGAVDVCNVNPDVVYIGTGEVQLRGNVQAGDGVYKSTDAGETWEHVGLREARNFGRVRIHPEDCDVVYAAAFGHYGEPNPERGIYRSTNGGETWERILYHDDLSGGVDLSISPTNPDIVYAALWQAYRKTWQLSSGGPGSGLYRSTNGGETWTEVTHNPGLLPEGMVAGKIGVDVSPVDPDRVYAIVEADSGGVYRSDDGGETWEWLNDERKLRQRAFYYTRIYADPQVEDWVYVLNTGFYQSKDGGETFPDSLRIRVPHGDNHDLWIAPSDNQRMVNGNDGGGNVSFNGGETWTEQDYSTAQIYRISDTEHFPYHVCGGQQDNSTVCVPTQEWGFVTANDDYFYAVGGCESGYVAPDPENTDVFYAGCYGGYMSRFDHGTGQERTVSIWPENPMGWSAEDLGERFQWTFPILFSPHDPDLLFASSQHLFRTTNEGQSWERISPDLTRADPATLGASGGPITKDQTSIEYYATIFAVELSTTDPDVIWTGSDDGLVHLTRDGGANWTDVTPVDLPVNTKITTIDASPHAPGTAYLTGHRSLLGDVAPYVYRTRDYGASWTSITGGLPADEVARSIRVDPVREGLVFLGTERGVWVSFDQGTSWQSLSQDLPVTQVADLLVKDNSVALATHGRGFWIMDDISALRQLTPAVAGQAVHLFEPAPTVRGIDRGVTVFYSLAEPADEVTIEFLDGTGNVIRSYSAAAEDTAMAGDTTVVEEEQEQEEEEEEEEEEDDDDDDDDGPEPTLVKGLNRFVWSAEAPGFTEFPGLIMWGAGEGEIAVPPGTYQVRLTADGVTQTRSLEVRMDPRLEGVTPEDLAARYELARQIRDKTGEVNDAVRLIRGVERQLEERNEATDAPAVERALDELQAGLDEIEATLYQVRNRSGQDPLNFPIRLNNRLAALLSLVESSENRPTDQMYDVWEKLRAEAETELARLESVLSAGLPELNAVLSDAGMAPVEREMIPEEGDAPWEVG